MSLMNKLTTEKRKRIINALVEGNSIRATCRMTDTAKGTVLKLLADIGRVCADYQDRAFRNLPCKRIQCDEIWQFCYAKEKNVPAEMRGTFGFGDVWTFTAICADTKLVPSWLVGKRDAGYAAEFVNDLAGRLANRVQISTDGHRMYLEAVEGAFGTEVDYAMIIKLYNESKAKGNEKKYSPGECCGIRKTTITGDPDERHISTSYVERQNLTMRMSMRRFTRLSNGFSKKLENHKYAVALHFMFYNFCRIHQSIRVTPAMEAGVADHVWSIEEVVSLLDASEVCAA
jgi:IS1 family transposase